MAGIQAKHQKVSGFGESPSGPKKDGYASGSVPDTERGHKRGKDDKKGYSGPSVAQAEKI